MPLSDRPYAPGSGAASVASQIPLNTQATANGATLGPLPIAQVLTSAAETLILGFPVSANQALVAALGPDTTIEQTVFDLFISGILTTESTTNLTLKVYEGNAIAGGNLLGSSGAIAQNGTTGTPVTEAYFIHAQLIFDSVSGTLAGKIELYLNKTVVAAVSLSNFVTGFRNTGNPSANPPTVANLPEFCLSLTSNGAAGGAATTINVQKFSVG